MVLLASLVVGLACLGQEPATWDREVWMDKSVEEWMTLLDRSDATTRRAYVGLYIGTSNTRLDHLKTVFLKALDDPDLLVRMSAAGVILMSPAYTEAETRHASDVLGGSLVDPNYRGRAIYSLHNDPSKAVPALPSIARVIGRIEDEENEWRFVTEIFRDLGDRAAPAVGELIGVLKSGDARAKARAATLLASIGKPAVDAVPSLLVAIRYADRDVVFACYDAIRRIDPARQPRPSPASRFIPAEVAALGDPDLTAGYHTLERIARVGPEAIGEIPAILRFGARFLKQPNPSGWEAIFFAGQVGRDKFGEGLIPALAAQIRDDNGDLALVAVLVVSQGREQNADAIPVLTALLGKTGGGLKGNVATTIGVVGSGGHVATPILIPLTGDADPNVRRGAVVGLRYAEDPSPEAIDAVKSLKDDADRDVREAVSVALKMMGVEPLTTK